jgi:hypothetical protein
VRTWVIGTIAVTCWAFLALKLRHLRRDPRNPFLAALCAAIAMLTISTTFALPPLASRMEQATGVLALWYIVPSVLIWPAALITFELWAHPTKEAWRRTRPYLVAYAAVAMLMIGLGIRGAVNPHLVDIAAHAQEPEPLYGTLPYVRDAVLLYALTSALGNAHLSTYYWRYSRLVDRRWLRRGLRTLGVANLITIGNGVAYGVFLVGLRFSVRIMVAEQLWVALASLGVLTAAVGATMPVWGPWLDRLKAYRRLYPLWLALSQANPDILLDPPGRVDRWNPWHINYRLYRRVIEIRDGWLALRPYMTHIPTPPASGDPHGDEDDQDRQAAVSAATLAAALHVRATGGAPHEDSVPDNGVGGHDLATEIAWLVNVANKFTALSASGISPDSAPLLQPLP